MQPATTSGSLGGSSSGGGLQALLRKSTANGAGLGSLVGSVSSSALAAVGVSVSFGSSAAPPSTSGLGAGTAC